MTLELLTTDKLKETNSPEANLNDEEKESKEFIKLPSKAEKDCNKKLLFYFVPQNAMK